MIERRGGRGWPWLAAALLLAIPLASVGGVNFSGSGYVDYLGVSSPSARAASLTGITPELALKVEVDAHESLAFSGKVCFGCHGLEVDRAYLDFTPSSRFNVQAGRIVVPFGDFALRYDPGSHRTASKPLPFEMGRLLYYGRSGMNLGVVPTPYVDTGALVYGQTWLGDRVQVWYGAYAVAGLKGENDIDFAASRAPYYTDNNRQPSAGGRIVLTLAAPGPRTFLGDLSLGLSGMHGRYDRQMSLAYTALGVDASARLGPVTLRAEAVGRRTDIDPSLPGYRYGIIDPWIDKSGFYVEAEHLVGSRVVLVYRVDGLRRAGVPLPEADERLGPDSRILRYTQGVQVAIVDALFGKLGYEYWWFSDLPTAHAFHAGIGGTF